MQEFTDLLNYINTNGHTIVAVAIGSGVLSIALEVLLTKFHVNSSKLAFSLLHVFSGATALVGFYLGASGKDTAGTYAGLTIIAQFWHRFVVSSANTKYVTPFLQWLETQNNGQVSGATATVTTPAGTSTVHVSGVSTPTGTTVAAMATGADAKPFTLDAK